MFKLMAAQENILNEMHTYEEKEVCVLGGYFFIDEKKHKLESYERMFEAMPRHFAALSLVLNRNGEMEMRDEAQVVAKSKINYINDSSREALDGAFSQWACRPLDTEKALYEFAVFCDGNGRKYGVERFHHIVVDKRAMVLIVEWQKKYMDAVANGDRALI